MNTTTTILSTLGLGLSASLAWGMVQDKTECAQAAQVVRSKAAPRAQTAEPSESVAARSLLRFLGEQEVQVATIDLLGTQDPDACQETAAIQSDVLGLGGGEPVVVGVDTLRDPLLATNFGIATIDLLDVQDRTEEAARALEQAKLAEVQAQRNMAALTRVQAQRDRASLIAAERSLAKIQEQMAGLRPNHSRYRVLQKAADELDLDRLREEDAWLENADSIALRASQSTRPSVNQQQDDKRTRRLEARIEALERRLAAREARETRPESPFGSRGYLFEPREVEEFEASEEVYFEPVESEAVEAPEWPVFEPLPEPEPQRAPASSLWRSPRATPPTLPRAVLPRSPRLPQTAPRAPRLPQVAQRAPRLPGAAPQGQLPQWNSATGIRGSRPAPNTTRSVDLDELSVLLREMREQVSDLRSDLRSLRQDLRQLSASRAR